jgi:hypothetical protein
MGRFGTWFPHMQMYFKLPLRTFVQSSWLVFLGLSQLGSVVPHAGRVPVSPGSAERGQPNERGSLQLIKNK